MKSRDNTHKNQLILGRSVNAISIKRLTLLGFSLVAFPLVLALLYSAKQVNVLSEQSSAAVYNVAELVKTNRELSLTLNKLERFASQYLILKEQELLDNVNQQLLMIHDIFNSKYHYFTDQRLNQDITELNQQLELVILLLVPDNLKQPNLAQVQAHFKKLAKLNQDITQRSNELIQLSALQIEKSAAEISNTMVNSLIIIPISLSIALIFIVLITKPLKLLIKKIQLLEKGKFENKITISGSPEVREIADALELMRSRLHSLELQKSSFIRHISHELKTPLAAIREGTELLYDNSVGELNQDQTEVTKIIRQSVTRLQKLIEDLLDFNIVLDSTSLQDSEKVLLAPLLKSALAQRVLDIKRKQLKVNVTCNNIQLICNSKQLSVIVDNILSNAIKYSPDNGEIVISAQVDQQRLTLSITDQGPGLSSDIQNKVFDAFYQGPAPENSQIKGSGLGLTIVKELLMRLHGDIRILPNQPHGSQVIITLEHASQIESQT